jgi:hypothetical protein
MQKHLSGGIEDALVDLSLKLPRRPTERREPLPFAGASFKSFILLAFRRIRRSGGQSFLLQFTHIWPACK